jgi:hypothetical protein
LENILMIVKLASLVPFIAVLASAQAAEVKTLFDGKSLDDWIVTDCKVEVQDGALLLKEGNGLVRSKEKYGDFVLTWECKPLADDKWDSGVYIRWDLPLPKGRPWPRQYQVNMAKGMEGNVQGLKGAESKGLFKPGEWNKFKLTVAGTRAELAINDKPAWKADGLKTAEGYIGLQAETPSGGQFLYRKITIEPVKK